MTERYEMGISNGAAETPVGLLQLLKRNGEAAADLTKRASCSNWPRSFACRGSEITDAKVWER